MGHDIVEVLKGDETIVVKVGPVEDIIQLVVIKILSQLDGNLLQLVDGNFSLDK